jgi:DNA-binding response OmpR family regulator
MAKIMVVDDDSAIVRLVEIILKSSGHEVIGASSGENALKILNDIKPDFILLDLLMPRLDGWETLGLIRQESYLNDVPVSILSVLKLTPKMTGLPEFGELIDYIQKPFSKEALIERVNETLENLKVISQKKARLISLASNRQKASKYQGIARLELLRKRVLENLKENLEKTSVPSEKEELNEAINSEQSSLQEIRKKRENIEKKAFGNL